MVGTRKVTVSRMEEQQLMMMMIIKVIITTIITIFGYVFIKKNPLIEQDVLEYS